MATARSIKATASLGMPLLVVDHPEQAARVGIARIASQGRRVEPRRTGQVARVMEP